VRLLWGLIFLFFSFSAYAGPVKEGSYAYTVQVASFKTEEEAVNFAARLKERFPSVRVVPYKGAYRVRIGLFKSYKEALEFTESYQFKELFKDYFIAKTRYVPGREVKLPEPVKLPPPQSLAEVIDFQSAGLNGESQIKKEEANAPLNGKDKKSSSEKAAQPPRGEDTLPILYLFLLIPPALLLFVYLIRRSKRGEEGRALEEYVAKLLEEGRYEEVIEVALPFARKNPKNTFVKGAIAESYQALGRYLEAEQAYSEVAEELERRGLKELAEEVRKKAEELYGREFKG